MDLILCSLTKKYCICRLKRTYTHTQSKQQQLKKKSFNKKIVIKSLYIENNNIS